MFFLQGGAYAQSNSSSTDSLKLKYPFLDSRLLELNPKPGFYLPNPSNIQRSVEFDPISKRYVIREKIGDRLYREPQYLSIEEYQKYETEQIKRDYWKQLSEAPIKEAREPGFVPRVTIKSESFERIFGGSTIDIRPQGTAELTLAGRINKNQNPLFNERQRRQGNFDFDQRIQMNVLGQIGNKLRITTNYNTEAQFDFENQMKLDYTGRPDEIVQKIEAGNVNLPLSSSLITGSQALFGLKTQLQFGKLNVTSVFSQQKSQQREITITNGSQQNEFRLTADNYEANRHYFLAHYFRENYNKYLSKLPIITSDINITRIEVWVTNRNNSTVDSRDIIGLIDLGENNQDTIYNDSRVAGGPSYSRYPAAGPLGDPAFPQHSNNLLQQLAADPGNRLTNSNNIYNFFGGNTDNYSKLSYARRLTEREFTLNPRLGYISLNTALNADEVLAVAYRYNANGVEYQVGEFSTDVPVDPASPNALYVKLLKGEALKTSLPTWHLMMKNIYSLGAYQVSRTGFNLNIYRLDEKTGVEIPVVNEGDQNTNGKLWLQLTNLDRLNQAGSDVADGFFDFVEGVTIDPLNGRVTFPLVEPFGEDLGRKFSNPSDRSRYAFPELYDLTKADAQQLFTHKNRYIIRGTFQSEVSSEFQLNAINVPPGSVQVVAGTLPLQEGADFTVDYNSGRVRILNQALLNSGQPIRIKLENNELFGLQQRSLFGSRFDYRVNHKLNLGGTVMNLTERPLTPKVNIGEESISNTIWGMDANYSSDSRWLTRLVDKIPFINTKETSSITFTGEFANLIPGHPNALNFAGSRNGASYLDDFEGSRSIIDLKSASAWQISGTPQRFPEANLANNLEYGKNRARLAFYNIDPIFFNRGSTLTPTNIKNNKNEQSNHYVREVLEQEVFPFKQSSTGQPLTLPTLDLAYYPNVRGQYNFSSDVNPDGTLTRPQDRWGGIFRRLESNDFEALNIEFIEFWVMDPFIYNRNSSGGDLYFNLGNISEDILKDGKKSLENGLPADGDLGKTDESAWGRVARLQPVIQAFDNNPEARKYQDVGLDGLSSNEEQRFFLEQINQIKGRLAPQAAAALEADPASDDYHYYRGSDLDNANAGVLQRYQRYNGLEGNSKTIEQSRAETGIENTASTPLPDGEDVNRDNTTTIADEYFEYKVSLRPQDMVVGSNNITDKVTASVKLPNGTTQQVNWYQFKVPLAQYHNQVGNIQDFKSIRFIRTYLTNFRDTTILRMARMQLVRGEWRRFNAKNLPGNEVIVDKDLNTTNPDNSTIEVTTVNIEENGKRTPIPYVVPPGIERERDFSNFRGETVQNEQSLAVNVQNLRDGYGRAAFRTTFNDFRSYKRLEMFIHAEGEQLRDNDVSAIIRIGTDNQNNYYEYEIPLKVTQPNTRDAYRIWPEENKLDIALQKLQEAKAERNNSGYPQNLPFVKTDGNNKITVVGQPDLSKVRVYMVGVKNPLRNAAAPGSDDGLEKSAQVWFNELRLTDFDERGGWAATARINAKLADFGDLTLSGSKSTVGFGSIDRRVSERSRNDDTFFDMSSSLELGKFFPERAGIKVPFFFNWSSQHSIPQFDPRFQDMELKTSLTGLSGSEKNRVHQLVDDVTQRRSINFTNVRKIKTDPNSKSHVWDIENFSATYAFTEFSHRDYITELALQKNYRAGLAYNYSGQSKGFTPFEKLIKSNTLALLRDFNFNLMPSLLNFRIDVDRLYTENTLRDNSPNNVLPTITNFNKNFQMSRVYGISWNLTKSVQLDFNATNYSIIDEPEGRIDGRARDTIWNNLKKLGRTTDYNHTLNVNYTVPINKIPGFGWTNLVARYGTNFNWRTEPLITLRDPDINFGNTIQNSRTIQLNPSLNFVSLYNKSRLIRSATSPEASPVKRFLVNTLTSVKNVTGAYTRTEGTFLPGYLPQTNVFGYDLDASAPGWDFVFGSQQDIRGRAIRNGWITRDASMNQLYINTKKEDMNFRGTIEPLKDLRIELTAVKSQNFNYSTTFKYDSISGGFQNQSPITNGDFSISFFSLRTAFAKESPNGTSRLFEQFERNRQIVSRRLGAQNPNSQGTDGNGFAEGYKANSQDVVVASFLAAYTGKDAERATLSRFPKIPIPNWRITYNGLTKYPFFNKLFASFDVSHGYRSTYNVNSFNTLARYQEANGAVNIKDANGNFLPFYQYSQVTLFEQFVPLLGVDFRLKNNMSMNFEYRKSRALSLSLSNSQLAQQRDDGIIFGFGYRTANFRFPFGLLGGRKLSNDLNMKVDFALNDRKTTIFRADVDDAEVSSGAKNISFRPSIDYVLNQRVNLRMFYDGNITRPYTSQTFNTAFSNFGLSLRFTLQ
ncbi:cell surface protein SprA [Pedobacter sp. SYSU D00535]|uniref:T9SS outer membrane translocon Sov/SprA n=1 Tax=Pedobacter sp. SYSU D00535 TaxID=2810308 RepID=UPI001A961DC6|nr:cell surface protein SprA [Pedobacter sp. SYSU D00535]